MMKKPLLLALLLCATAAADDVVPSFQVTPPVTSAPSQAISANAELLMMMEQLQREVQTLRGLVEEQSYQIKLLKEQGRERYRDLDGRLLLLSKSSSAASAPVAEIVQTPEVGVVSESSTKAAPTQVQQNDKGASSDAAQTEYNKAYALIGAKDFSGAVTAFYAFIDHFPNSELTGNAYYWLGEVFLVQDQPEKAKQAFVVAARQFPEHRKVPDALYKLGMTSLRLSEKSQAELYLKEVVSRFPATSSAKLAQDQLNKLR
ncbi:MAG: tol-pal system protein YbgF [Hahellaceae bacterium]|nr:tol-pal system protein YbgF [Hahellaceae bacterium]